MLIEALAEFKVYVFMAVKDMLFYDGSYETWN
jgi:hypothetical protein